MLKKPCYGIYIFLKVKQRILKDPNLYRLPIYYLHDSYTSVSYSYGVVDSPIIRIGKALHGAKVTQTNYPIHVANSPLKPFVQPIRKQQQSTER